MGGAPGTGKRTIWPHPGQAYSLTPRWRSGVRHFGHGIGWAVTHAANISWERRSESVREASAAVAVDRDGGGGAAGEGTGPAITTSGRPVRALDSRPHCGQTARLALPVDWSGTRQLGQSVFMPVGVSTGAGAGGGRTGSERAGGVAALGGGGATSAGGRAQRTVRRPGS